MAKKKIVLTMYGNKDTVKSVSVSLREDNSSCQDKGSSTDNAEQYCRNINKFQPLGDDWIHARIIDENERIILSKPKPFGFESIRTLNPGAIQKALRDVSKKDLAKAFKDIDSATKETLLNNLSKRAAIMLQEDVEALGAVRPDEIEEAKDKIVELFLGLEKKGYVVRSC